MEKNENTKTTQEKDDSVIIYAYTREQAIKDGVLVDISETSEVKEAGFTIPVVLTKSVYDLVKVPKELEGVQDFKGRLWDTCFMATTAFKNYTPPEGEDKSIVPFRVAYQMADGIKTVDLWLVFNEVEGFTIMKPEDY